MAVNNLGPDTPGRRARRADTASKGHMLPDATAILGAIDVVFGECDR